MGLAPAVVRELTRAGHETRAQTGAGLGIGFNDDDYRAAGAEIASDARNQPIAAA